MRGAGERGRILFFRYGSICEPAVIAAWGRLGYAVDEVMARGLLTPSEELALVRGPLLEGGHAFVFSINYFPTLSEACSILKLPYACWVVDSPVLELYSGSMRRPWNRIFLFDRALYREFSPRNPGRVFYLPLASDVASFQPVCRNVTPGDGAAYGCDVSFVGSLYSEKCPYDRVTGLPDYFKGYLDGVIEAQLLVHGINFIRELVTDEAAGILRGHIPGYYQFPEGYEGDERALAADLYVSAKVTELERERLLAVLSEEFPVDVYTGSDTSRLPKVRARGLASTYPEMPKIFRLSKINLNMTARSIKTGLPLRVWDILACGGFLLTNYQSEIPEYFEAGKDLECFSSEKELLEKCRYYLEHGEERERIAENGFRKVEQRHQLDMRLREMLECI